MMKTSPVVFAVHDTYQIMVPTSTPSLMWVRVGEEVYYDDSNGILRSADGIHRVTVPTAALNAAREYTVCERDIIARKAYFTESEDVRETVISFRPVEGDTIRCYHIADAHNRVESPLRAAAAYGDIDFLILNGDIPEDSGNIENFDTIYEIAAQITHGNIPVVFARGNHDLRGVFAEKIGQYCPTENGRTYFTFRLGSLWGVVLDCGEDKDDDHPEYGSTVCCHAFRMAQSQFLHRVAAEKEYADPGIRYRVVVMHNPFTDAYPPPFSIESEIYTCWARILREEIGPDLMITGHRHTLEVRKPGCPEDALGQPCTVLVGAKPDGSRFTGAGIAFGKDGIRITFTDSDGGIGQEIPV